MRTSFNLRYLQYKFILRCVACLKMSQVLLILLILPLFRNGQIASATAGNLNYHWSDSRVVFQVCIENDELIFVGATFNGQDSYVFSCDESLLNSSVAQRLTGRALWLEDLGLEKLKSGFLKARVGDVFLGRNKFRDITPALLGGINMNQLYLDFSEIEVIRADSFVNEYLTTLRLNDNLIRLIEPGAFSGLKKLTWMSLLRNRIKDLPFANSLSENMDFLNLESNLIACVPANSFTRLKNLRYLGLEDNLISELNPGAFNGLKSLITLTLHFNKIKSLKSGVFDGLVSLASLYLNNNEIIAIEPGSFKGLDKLASLDLSHNHLVNIGTRTFKYLSGLQVLKYNNNNLTTIDEDTFGDLRELQKLEAMSNGIKHIKIGAFKYTNKLETLILINNHLTDIEIGTLRGLENLTEINLSINQLMDLKPGIFDGLPKLQTLKLDYNNITYLRNGTFSNLKQLKFLTLTDNKISDMDVGVFTNVPYYELQLKANKLTKIVPGWFSIANLTHLVLENNNITQLTHLELAGLPGLKYLWFKGLHEDPTKV